MAGADSIEMAFAVSSAGGLGSLGCGPLKPDALLALLLTTSDITERPVNFNFFCHAQPADDPGRYRKWTTRLAPYYEEVGLPVSASVPHTGIQPFNSALCDMLLDLTPRVVSFHFGLPAGALVDRLKGAGIKILSTATTVEEARWLEARGCDAVIAQGSEAGGHRGMFLSSDIDTQIGTMALVPQIVDAVSIPVIAAGGIGDARGIVAALALGASGVQMGTAFLRCDEAGISEVYRAALAAGGKTALTNVYSGRPTRVRANRLVADIGPFASDVPDFPLGFCVSGPLRAVREQAGLGDFSPHYCGQAAALGKSGTARDLVCELVAETQMCLNGHSGR